MIFRKIKAQALAVALAVFTLPLMAGAFDGDSDWAQWQRLFYNRMVTVEVPPEMGGGRDPVHFRIQEVTAVLPGPEPRRVRDMTGYAQEQCVTCHIGISPMSSSHPESFGCTVCHGGDGNSLNAEEAHASLIFDPNAGTGRRNPSSLSVVGLSCGRSGCHAGHLNPELNHVERVRRSMMGSLSGMIAGFRYQWGAQGRPEARYGMTALKSQAGEERNPGSVDSLQALPYFSAGERNLLTGESQSAAPLSNHPADSVLRSTCRQCHLDSPPAPGDYRSQGCAACHVPYAGDGLYRGADPTVDREEPGHPRRHRLEAVPPPEVCLTCHKTFDGMLGEKKPDHSVTQSLLKEGQPVRDVHFEAGMECVDCHTQSDIMGDGQIYSRQYQAVEIRCTTCHGDSRRFPSVLNIDQMDDPAVRLSQHYPGVGNQTGDWMVVTSRYRKMSNVKALKEGIFTFGKRSGKKFPVPLVKNNPAHSLPGHEDKLSCTACHSAWVPQCTGCHMTFNAARPEGDRKPWNPFQFEIQFQQPALMVGPDGKIRPMLAQPDRRLTALDEKGHVFPVLNQDGDATGQYREFGFVNPQGFSGSNLAYATQPHSVTRKVRDCASCHVDPVASGLGEGHVVWGTQASGKKDRISGVKRDQGLYGASEIDSSPKLTLQGQPIAGVHQPGARLLNQEELVKIFKVGNCLPCHREPKDPIFQNMKKSYKFSTSLNHKKLVEKKARTGREP